MKKMRTWIVVFILIAAALLFLFSALEMSQLSHRETVTGFVTDVKTEYPCVQGNGCAEIHTVEISGEEYHYLDAANDTFPFADIHIGDRVVATTQGYELRLPFSVRLFHPEIVELKVLER